MWKQHVCRKCLWYVLQRRLEVNGSAAVMRADIQGVSTGHLHKALGFRSRIPDKTESEKINHNKTNPVQSLKVGSHSLGEVGIKMKLL